MGGIFGGAKAPKIEPVKEIPIADDSMMLAEKRRKQAARVMQQGIQSTRLTDNTTQMTDKPIGQ
jgi:hypothetical protein